MKYIPVFGLEIHAELLTRSKIFCTCKNEFGGEANTRICPVCIGMPGTLPVLNKEAVTLAVRAGIATNCTINNFSSFDRKNYFYPDLPKAYQITQFTNPICTNGYIEISNKKIKIREIHIEEDAGKLIHKDDYSLIDYNRCGVGLIEIITQPDFRTSDEIIEFIEQIALRLKYADVCDVKMQNGSLRVDVNISVMPENSTEFGTRTELKNLNSFKSIKKAISFEIERQIKMLESGLSVLQETLRFNEDDGKTYPLRSKETADEYRYFPEPEIPPIFISDEHISEIKASMPEMPQKRFKRYTEEYRLSCDDANLILNNKIFSDFYDETIKINNDYKYVSNMMLTELNRHLNESNITIEKIKFSPADLAELVTLSSKEIISKGSAKDILKIMFYTGENATKIAEENGFILKDDTEALENVIKKILSQYPDSIQSYNNGNQKIIGFFMGKIMSVSGKSVNPVNAKKILIKNLNNYFIVS